MEMFDQKFDTKFEKKYSILIIEDDEQLNRTYAMALEHRFNIEFYSELSEFLNMVENYQNMKMPDLIISDIKLKDGIMSEFLATHGDKVLAMDVPIMIVSQIDDYEMYSKLYKFGVCEFLRKNFSINELIAKIDNAITQNVETPDRAEDKLKRYKLEKRLTKRYAHFTKVELAILGTLVLAPNFELSREELIKRVWDETMVTSNSLAVHLTKMRKKLDNAISIIPSSSGYIRLEIHDPDLYAPPKL